MVTWGGVTTFGQGAKAPAPAPATLGGGFSFGGATSTPTTPTTPSTATTSLFGASASNAGSTPGAKSTSFTLGGTFGGTTGSSLFGTPTTAPSPATGMTSLFGAPAPAPGGGLFGTPAPATGGLFTTSSLFSKPTTATTTTNATAASIAAAQQPQQAAMLAQLQAQQRQEAAKIESSLMLLRAAYDQNVAVQSPDPSPLIKFQYIFYDPIDATNLNQMQRPRPAHVEPKKWSEAMAQNPDPEKLIPVSIVGADALSNRIAGQQEKANRLKGYVEQLNDAHEQVKKSAIASQNKVDYLRRNQEIILLKMLQVMRKVEILRCLNLPLQRGEVDVAKKLEEMRREVDIVGSKLREVEETGRSHIQKMKMMKAASGGGRDDAIVLTDEDKVSLCKVLDEQRSGLAALTKIVSKDVRDIDILKKEVAKVGKRLGSLPGLQ